MTGLSSDLCAAVNPHQGKPADAMVEVPIGLLRAALLHVNRFDAGPLFDRMRTIALVGHVEMRAEPEFEVIAA